MIGSTIALALISIFQKQWLKDAIEWMKIAIESLGNWNYAIA